jgi:ADP-heptose:LPS heptosyltransferase
LKSTYYQEQWLAQKDAAEPQAINSLSKRIASSFIDRYYYSDEYNREHIHLLCEMATHFNDDEFNQIAAKALFGTVIERLCDDLEELQTETYNRLICQVVNFLCQLPEGSEIESELYSFHLRTEEQLYQRIESIRLTPDRKLPSIVRPKRVVILSRVTIGADIAITSVICQRVAQNYPDAEIVVVGNDKLQQVFAEESGIRVHELAYSRRGGLLEKFQVWLQLLAQIRDLTSDLSPAEFLILDPDSRLTQLGVLPLVPLQNYRFFNSRGKKGSAKHASMAQLTNQWLDNILGNEAFCFPKVWAPNSSQQSADSFRSAIDPDRTATLITVNLGVGGNERKRVPGDFEKDLILTLLREDNIKLVLDLGFGEEERAQSSALLTAAKQAGIETTETTFSQIQTVSASTRLIGVECNIGEITALIGQSDEFIGYDSACQHIAAAESVKTFTIFAGTNNVRFIRRWQACGKNTSEIIYVDTLSKDSYIDTENIIATLMDFRTSDD